MSKIWEILRKKLEIAIEPHGAIGEFCKKTGFSRGAVQNWRDQKSSPNIVDLDRILAGLELTLEDISPSSTPNPITPDEALAVLAAELQKPKSSIPQEILDDLEKVTDWRAIKATVKGVLGQTTAKRKERV